MLGSYATVKKVAIKSPVECDDPWVQDLAVSAMTDADYMAMVSHIGLGTEIDEMPQEYELSKLSSCYKELSTLTLKGGKTLILRDNSEIMVPKSERENILQIAHQTHLGQEKWKWWPNVTLVKDITDPMLKKKLKLATPQCSTSGLATHFTWISVNIKI